ncbi:hypothetical protein [Tannerella forsythia]|uniref:hypothetical protein n=1 Tax=Tannerella forsythia TaxID=28112 RepID=UPI000618B903|nr:hypothetical protein [Tannerella forsythia]BAR48579.1 hypothetical protein TF3313_1030 [Tannerella forsythia 3313]
MKNEKCSPKDFSFFVFHFPITPCGHEGKEQTEKSRMFPLRLPEAKRHRKSHRYVRDVYPIRAEA